MVQNEVLYMALSDNQLVIVKKKSPKYSINNYTIKILYVYVFKSAKVVTFPLEVIVCNTAVPC